MRFKFLFLIILCFLLTGCGKNIAIIEANNNLSFEYGTDIYLHDLINITDGYIINDTLINYENIGPLTVNIDYIDIKKHKDSIKVDINLIDTTAPILNISSNIYTTLGNEVNICKSGFYGDNADRNLTCQVSGEYDINNLGIYNLKVDIIDDSNNVTSKNIKLHVVDEMNYSEPTIIEDNLEEMILKYKTDKTMIGIDVSTFQGDIDWQLVKNSGIEFAIIRIGYGHTNDGLILDNNAIKNLTEAKNVGLKIGGYFYSYATEIWEAEEQANFIVDNLKDFKFDLPIAFDYEDWSKFNTYNINFYDINRVAKRFMQILEDNGFKSMIYGSKYYLNTVWNIDEYPTWLAHYTYNTDYDKEYFLWQFTNTGIVPGINSYVDLDILYLE